MANRSRSKDPKHSQFCIGNCSDSPVLGNVEGLLLTANCDRCNDQSQKYIHSWTRYFILALDICVHGLGWLGLECNTLHICKQKCIIQRCHLCKSEYRTSLVWHFLNRLELNISILCYVIRILILSLCEYALRLLKTRSFFPELVCELENLSMLE